MSVCWARWLKCGNFVWYTLLMLAGFWPKFPACYFLCIRCDVMLNFRSRNWKPHGSRRRRNRLCLPEWWKLALLCKLSYAFSRLYFLVRIHPNKWQLINTNITHWTSWSRCLTWLQGMGRDSWVRANGQKHCGRCSMQIGAALQRFIYHTPHNNLCSINKFRPVWCFHWSDST